jgi:hypothetical protein
VCVCVCVYLYVSKGTRGTTCWEPPSVILNGSYRTTVAASEDFFSSLLEFATHYTVPCTVHTHIWYRCAIQMCSIGACAIQSAEHWQSRRMYATIFGTLYHGTFMFMYTENETKRERDVHRKERTNNKLSVFFFIITINAASIWVSHIFWDRR